VHLKRQQLRQIIKEVLAESTELDKALYGSLEKVIAGSNFWEQGNTEDDGDYEDVPGLGLMHQTSAAQYLQDTLQNAINNAAQDIIIAVQSPELDANPGFLLTPDKPQYPDSVISGGYATVTPDGKQAVVLNMSLFDDSFNDDDVNAQRIARKGAAILRHEIVHLQQVAARAESEGISLLDAFENFKKEPKSIPPSGAGRQQYIKSHIEVDAHAHQAADELLSLYGKEEALRLISKTVDFEDLGVDLPHAIEDYLIDNPSGKTARQFRKKVYEYINSISEKLSEASDPDSWFGTGFKLGTSVNLKKDINVEGTLIGEKGQYKLVLWSKSVSKLMRSGQEIITKKSKQNIKMFKLAKGFTQASLERVINNPEKGVLTIETTSTIVPQGSTGKTARGSRGESTVGELTNIKDLALEITGIQFAWDFGSAIGRLNTALAAFARSNLHPSERESYKKELDEAFVQLAFLVIVTAVILVSFGIGKIAVQTLASRFPILSRNITKAGIAASGKASDPTPSEIKYPTPSEIKAARQSLTNFKETRLSKAGVSTNTGLAKEIADEAIKAADKLYGAGKGVIALPTNRQPPVPKIKKSDALRSMSIVDRVAIEKQVGGKLLSKAGAGADGEVFIIRLDDAIGIHKEVALKIIGNMSPDSNMKAARWILKKRASLDADTAKYLPRVLKIGKLKLQGEFNVEPHYIVMERLLPLPSSVRKLFLDTEKNISQKILKDPDLFDSYIDVFVTQLRKSLDNRLTGIMGPGATNNIKSIVIKVANNPKTVSPEANALFNKIDWSQVNLINQPAQKESLKKIVPGVLEYLVKLRKTVKFETRQREKANKDVSNVYKYLKLLDDEIARISSTRFWVHSRGSLGKFTPSVGSPPGTARSIGRNLGDTTIADTIGASAAESDPAVKGAINAMAKLEAAGFQPMDLHSENWLLRPGSGEIVMADFGRFNVKWAGAQSGRSIKEAHELTLRKLIQQMSKDLTE